LWFAGGDEGGFETVWGGGRSEEIYISKATYHRVGLELRSTSSKKITEVRKTTNKPQRYM
jgi:hypothetical protein